MGLEDVTVSVPDFQLIFDHLATHRTPSGTLHRNMHMRQARKLRDRPATLHYLHAMFAARANEIEGAISGPSVFWRYKIRMTSRQTQLDVLARQCSGPEDERIQRRFLREVLDRVKQERAGGLHPFPKLTDGELYLRRRVGGTPPGHSTCQRAVSAGALHRDFVPLLQGWNLALLCP